MEHGTDRVHLNRTQRILIAVVVAGAALIAAIGFAGSYTAVRELALQKGFGGFAAVFPIGVDAGIAILLALDLLLTWLSIPFPLLRQGAWLLTAATISFNAAAAWPDPVGVGMHAVIPVLFVVTVEAARHAVGRLAAITADRYMEGVRLWRWLLAPLPTFRLWRRMMLWEIRKYDHVIRAEQERLIYQARLRSRYGRRWRWKAPIKDLLPLRIARYGVPLAVAAKAGTEEPDSEAREVRALDAHTGVSLREVVPHKSSFPSEEQSGDESAQRGRPMCGDPLEGPANESAPLEAIEDPHGDEDTEPELNDSAVDASAVSDGASDPLLTGERRPDGHGRPVDSTRGRGTEVTVEGDAAAGESRPPNHPDHLKERPENSRTGEQDAVDDRLHTEAIAGLDSNAAAVRYAVRSLGSTHTPTVVDWLASHGRKVNRGQAHRITSVEAERRQARDSKT